MTKFKVGDKVRITGREGNSAVCAVVGSIAEILSEYDGEHYKVLYDSGDGVADTRGWIAPFNLEKVSDKPTKNQRITTLEQNVVSLESEVAELKAKVEALEKAQSQTKTVTVIADAIARHNAKQPSPNEQRKAIIAEAKAFVKKYSGVVRVDTTPFTSTSGDTIVKIFVNKDKRIVTAVPHLVHVNTAISSDRRFAKCAPDDVFNADIGKAIALGRALGLDVNKFEQAVKPTEIIAGMSVKYADDKPSYGGETRKVSRVVGAKLYYTNGGNYRLDLRDPAPAITDDTEAQY